MVRPSPQPSTSIASLGIWDCRRAEASRGSEAHGAGRGECYLSIRHQASPIGEQLVHRLSTSSPAHYEGLTPTAEPRSLSARLTPHKELARDVRLMSRKVKRDVRCSQCGGKLGLGVRSRNLWHGCWREYLRFFSPPYDR